MSNKIESIKHTEINEVITLMLKIAVKNKKITLSVYNELKIIAENLGYKIEI